jgi:hypothetical protein
MIIPFNLQEFMQSGAFISGCRQAAGKTNLAKLICHTLLQNGITLHIMDSSRAWNEFELPVQTAKHDFTDFSVDLSKSQTIDMAELTHAQRVSLVNQLCGSVYKQHVESGRSDPEAIVFEEAQTYVFNGCSRVKNEYDAIMDYLTIGGNFNLSFMLITQFPALVDKSFVKATQQRYFGLSSEKNDTSYIKGFVEKEDSDRLKQQLGIQSKAFITKFLQRGQFVYQNRGHVEAFKCEKYQKLTTKPFFTITCNYAV